MSLARFYPIFDSASWLERMLPLRVRLPQLRIKGLIGPALVEEIGAAQSLARVYGATLVVNDHWQTAIDLGCDWVHLGQEDLDEAEMPAIRRAGLRLGISTRDHAELDRVLAFAPDYVALGLV